MTDREVDAAHALNNLALSGYPISAADLVDDEFAPDVTIPCRIGWEWHRADWRFMYGTPGGGS